MSAADAEPLDLVILRLLDDEQALTARDAAEFTGDSWQRCHEWLERFRKAGICRIVARPECSDTQSRTVYAGDRDEVKARIAVRSSEVHSGLRKLLG